MLPVVLAAIGALAGEPAVGDPHAADEPYIVVIEGDGPRASTSSARTLDREAVAATPGRSADELLRAMPGLHLSAHGGRGKAYQLFLRGFDAVHGGDLAVDLEGVPLNEVSNVHAHGYLDLHFLPTELISGLTLTPGTSRADRGDFAVAGSASYQLGLEDPGGELRFGGGTDVSALGTLTWRPKTGGSGRFAVANVDLGRGVGMARDWRQVRGGAGLDGRIGEVDVRGWVLAYHGAFASPGVLREDDLTAGRVSFYDAYPGSGGGRSDRVLGSVQATGGDGDTAWRALAWAGWRSLVLQQNFTGWHAHPVHGDGTEQRYQALTVGARGQGWWALDPLSLRAGLDLRLDALTLGQAGVRPDGTVWGDELEEQTRQGSAGAWVLTPLELPGLRIEPGLRAEAFLLHHEALAWAPVLAPKLALIGLPDRPLSLFASYGRGYRSPHGLGVGQGRAPVAVADTAEVGLTAAPSASLGLRATAFVTHVADELVFDHVAARYLLTGRTLRTGLEGGMVVRPVPDLRLELDVTGTEGRYAESGGPIPYAPRLLVSGGVYAEGLALGRQQVTGGLRGWWLGPRPLPGGFASHPAAVVDLIGTLTRGAWSVSLEVDNLLGARWRDGEFLFPSRWDASSSASELPVRHITAGAPPAARLTLGRRF